MSQSRRNRYNFNFNFTDVNDILNQEPLGQYEFGEVDPQISFSVTAANERRATIIALVLLKNLKVERWVEQFEEAMNSGDYETAIG